MRLVDETALATDGSVLARAVVNAAALDEAADALEPLLAGDARARPGTRLVAPPPAVMRLAARGGPLHRLAEAGADEPLAPARILAFDKRHGANWGVGWHQDRTIAVADRRDVPGFAHWSTRAGVAHVEPPMELLARMRTVRLHLDDCDDDNGALETIPGSHRLGRLTEDAVDALVTDAASRSHPARRGDALVLVLPIVHRSKKAAVPRRRRVLHVDYGPVSLPGGLCWALEAPRP